MRSGLGGAAISSISRAFSGACFLLTLLAVRIRYGIVPGVVVALTALLTGCGPNVPPQAVSWRTNQEIITPEATASAPVGALIVETDTDLVPNGGEMFSNVRRPYEIYSEDGHLIRYVNNQGARSGEEPVAIELTPGRYVVASTMGTVYRRVEVVVRNGQVTRVTERELRQAPPVFSRLGSR